MITDYDHTVDVLGRIAGLRVLEYGEAEEIGRRGGMTWIGDNSIEVGQPIVKGHAAERFVNRLGPGMHSYAFQVDDLDATIEHLVSRGVTVGVRPSQGFCFTDPRTTGGLLFEWSELVVPEDPRAGGSLPPHRVEPLLDIRTHAFVGAVLPDPLEWVDTFGALFGLTETFREPSAKPSHPVVGLATPDCTLALYRLPRAQSRELWGVEHTRARCHVLGLGVPDLTDARRALEQDGIPVLWRDDSYLAVDPAHTGEVPLILMEGLLPGDPRWLG